MADLLRTGNTMLNLSCPVCNNPLFRNREKQIFCPICNREVQIVNEPTTKKNEEISNKESNDNNVMSISNDKPKKTFVSLKRVLTNKIEWVKNQLESETQIDIIEKEVKIINSLLKTLRRLNNFID